MIEIETYEIIIISMNVIDKIQSVLLLRVDLQQKQNIKSQKGTVFNQESKLIDSSITNNCEMSRYEQVNNTRKSQSDSEEMIECFIQIDIDTNINEGSITKKYKWITSLELISVDDFRQKIFVKERNLRHDDMVKHIQIDKLLYLVVSFCEQDKPPITRIRTRKQVSDSEWITVPYPKQCESFYEYYISYQHTQTKECKRIISDIQLCHGKQFQHMASSEDQWEIATVPQPTYRLSKLQRPTMSEQEESGSNKSNPFNIESLQSKLSDRSEVRQNNSNLSDNSYYSCNDSYSKDSIDKDHFSDIDDISPKRHSNEMHSKHSNQLKSKKSSITEFHSIEQTTGPYYFLMKTIDLLDCHNQFQYTYEPKIINIHKLNNNLEEKYLRSIAKFCFPNGIRLFKKISGSGFQTFTLILTTDKGQRYYAYCLKYKEKMAQSLQHQLLKQLYQLHLINKNENYKQKTIFNEKSFCLVSKHQNTDAFHKILQNLYRALISFSSPGKGQEYFSPTKQEMHERKIKFFAIDLVDKLKIFSRNFVKKQKRNPLDPLRSIPTLPLKNQMIEFKWCGVNTPFPIKEQENKISMKSLYCLFKLLSIENILKILQAALLEKKIFIVSCMQTSILLVIEGLIGIMHPLRLSQPIIPIISEELLDLIEAPIPLVAGIGEQLVNESTMTKAVYVFLDCNKILALEDLPPFPSPLNKLSKFLKRLEMYDPEHVMELINFKEEVYSLGIHEIEQYDAETHEDIKVLFQDAIISIVKNYSYCYSKPAQEILKKNKFTEGKVSEQIKQVQSERLSKSTSNSLKYGRHLTFNEMYNTTKFIKMHERKEVPFYEEFVKSSIFRNLIQEKYNDPQNQDIQMIDKAIQRIEEDSIMHFSCLSIPVSSLKKQSFGRTLKKDYIEEKKITTVKAKTKNFEREVDERGSLTSIKQQEMKKNLSSKEQQKFPRKFTTISRKANIIPIQKQFTTNEKACNESEDFVHSQRMSEGAVYQDGKRTKNNQPKQIFQYRTEDKNRTMGFKICSMVNNVTKKITDSKHNIVNIFTQAKVNRLKKVYHEENKDKASEQKKKNLQVSIENTQNNLHNLTLPEMTMKIQENSLQIQQSHQVTNQ